MPPEQVIASIEELVQVLDLVDVSFVEERGRLVVRSEGEDAGRDWPEHVNQLSITQSKDKTGIRFRFRYVLAQADVEYVADLRAEYVAEDPFDVSQGIKLDFASRVAFMTTYPYIRASISGSATRLGQPVPILGLVRQGEFEVGSTMSESEVREAFFDNKPEL